jgi:hypothetical protein
MLGEAPGNPGTTTQGQAGRKPSTNRAQPRIRGNPFLAANDVLADYSQLLTA